MPTLLLVIAVTVLASLAGISGDGPLAELTAVSVHVLRRRQRSVGRDPGRTLEARKISSEDALGAVGMRVTRSEMVRERRVSGRLRPAALEIVPGHIGTSPLSTFREALSAYARAVARNHRSIGTKPLT
jgi:K+ transporter